MSTMQEKLLNVQRTNAWNSNSKLIDTLGYQLPESLIEKIKQETKAVSKMVLCTYNQFCSKFPSLTKAEISSYQIDERVMYIYYPQYEKERDEKRQRVIQMKKRLSLLDNIFSITPSENLKDFLYHLPLSTPINTFFTGKRKYVETMSHQKGNILYGNVEDDFFAVENGPISRRVLTVFVKEITPELMEHQQKTMLMVKKLQAEHGVTASKELRKLLMQLPLTVSPEQVDFDGSRRRVAHLQGPIWGDDNFFAVKRDNGRVTVYVREIDYVSELANRLVRCLQIDEETARFISDSLEHDRYYCQLERFNEFEDYTAEIAESLRAQQGDIIHDICQGDVLFSKDASEGGIQRDLPSAVLVKRDIMVFYPV